VKGCLNDLALVTEDPHPDPRPGREREPPPNREKMLPDWRFWSGRSSVRRTHWG